jgi:hypothetical protein
MTHPRGHVKAAFELRADGLTTTMIAVRTGIPRSTVPGVTAARSVRPRNCVEVYSYSKAWPCLLPQHGAGKKHERRIALEPWQARLVVAAPEFLLRGLIHSDGCRFMNTGSYGWRHPRYGFSNLSADIRGIFCGACDVLDLHWTTSGRTVYVSREADVARMDAFIGPKA